METSSPRREKKNRKRVCDNDNAFFFFNILFHWTEKVLSSEPCALASNGEITEKLAEPGKVHNSNACNAHYFAHVRSRFELWTANGLGLGDCV